MDNKEFLKRKLEYASPEDLLMVFLNDTDIKFQKVISLWKENKIEGTHVATRLADNILELKITLNTDIGDDETKKILNNIALLYDFMLNEISISMVTKDYRKIEETYKVFLTVKSIFQEDIQNMK